MKLLSLDRLVGPGRSEAENFEILCLELMRAPAGPKATVHRNMPPDGGIDLYDPRTKVAIQCKAYRYFRDDLVTAVRESAQAAKRTAAKTFSAYLLMIPFVPTPAQREKLNGALEESGAQVRICDGDELETRLYESRHIVERFFPSVVVVMPPSVPEIKLTTDESPLLSLQLVSTKTGQRIPLRSSQGALVGGLKNLLANLLRLPDIYSVNAASFVYGGPLHWTLNVARDGALNPLLDADTLVSAGLQDGDLLYLTFRESVEFEGGFLKTPGRHWQTTKIDSTIWNASEMNPDLMQSKDDSTSTDSLLDDYVAWQIGHIQTKHRFY